MKRKQLLSSFILYLQEEFTTLSFSINSFPDTNSMFWHQLPEVAQTPQVKVTVLWFWHSGQTRQLRPQSHKTAPTADARWGPWGTHTSAQSTANAGVPMNPLRFDICENDTKLREALYLWLHFYCTGCNSGTAKWRRCTGTWGVEAAQSSVTPQAHCLPSTVMCSPAPKFLNPVV